MMGNILFSAAAFLVALGVLITVHELGHFWVARIVGVKVLRFSIGFGKPLWKRCHGPDNIEYVIAAIPLGGYVKMLDEREGEVAPHELSRAFNRQSLLKRFAIVSAGPLFNFLFAILAYWIMYVAGIPGVKPIIGQIEPASIAAHAGLRGGDEIIDIAGHDTPTWSVVRLDLLSQALKNKVVTMEVMGADGYKRTVTMDLTSVLSRIRDGRVLTELGMMPLRPHIPAVIGELKPGERAEQSGLQSGDRVISADNMAIEDWLHWVEYIRSRPEQLIEITVERAGRHIRIELMPARVTVGDEVIGRIGAAPESIAALPQELRAQLKYPLGPALIRACVRTWEMSVLTLRMLSKMLQGEVSLDNLSGPITIAKYAGYTAGVGIYAFLAFLGIVSISLGVINLLPIPILDGGHLALFLVESVKGGPLSDELQLILQRIGMVLLALILSVAFYNDIARLFD